MKNQNTAQTGEECEIISDDRKNEAEQTPEQLKPVEISLAAIIEIARAVQHIDSLEELSGKCIKIGEKKKGLRRSIRSLEKICCDPRRIAALMLHAADNPDWAWVNFWAAFCPEISMRQMARLRHINVSSVRFLLAHTELPSDIYDFIPENH